MREPQGEGGVVRDQQDRASTRRAGRHASADGGGARERQRATEKSTGEMWVRLEGDRHVTTAG